MTNSKKRFALLIDGDNAQASLLPQIMAEINKHGEAIIRRIYGDWTTSQMNSWKKHANNYSFTPFQQFGYTKGKNSTDSALIIDAMDILHTKEVNAFCIVSSDSDYTRLATRIRENNFFVLGIGENKTPIAFINACNNFIFTETLKPQMKSKKPASTTQNSNQVSAKSKKKMRKLFTQAFELAVHRDTWTSLSELGKCLRKVDSNFDPKLHGNKQLLKLVQLYPETVEILNKGTEEKPIYYVRKK